ncbi:MAG: hypothetical protein ACOX8S_07870 [Christensenellales bacterium]
MNVYRWLLVSESDTMRKAFEAIDLGSLGICPENSPDCACQL